MNQLAQQVRLGISMFAARWAARWVNGCEGMDEWHARRPMGGRMDGPMDDFKRLRVRL